MKKQITEHTCGTETHVSEPIAVQGAGDKADGAQPLIRVWSARGPRVKQAHSPDLWAQLTAFPGGTRSRPELPGERKAQ